MLLNDQYNVITQRGHIPLEDCLTAKQGIYLYHRLLLVGIIKSLCGTAL